MQPDPSGGHEGSGNEGAGEPSRLSKDTVWPPPEPDGEEDYCPNLDEDDL